jgi:chromosome segregation ATPase
LIVVAAKIKHENLANEYFAKLREERQKNHELNNDNRRLSEELQEIEAYVTELQQMLVKAEEHEKAMENRLNIQMAAAAAKDNRIKDLRVKLKDMQNAGMTEAKKLEWIELENTITNLKGQLEASEKVIKDSQQKIFDLQGEILTAKMNEMFKDF